MGVRGNEVHQLVPQQRFCRLFSALSKANRAFMAQGAEGEPPYTASRMAESVSEAEPSTVRNMISKVWKLESGDRLQFKSDGKLVVMPPPGIDASSVIGTWLLNVGGKTVVITIQDKSDTMEIVALSEKELKLKSDGQELSLTASE